MTMFVFKAEDLADKVILSQKEYKRLLFRSQSVDHVTKRKLINRCIDIVNKQADSAAYTPIEKIKEELEKLLKEIDRDRFGTDESDRSET